MNVFRALRAKLVAPSNFRPSVAKKLVEEFCPIGGLVLDPCAGYGGRAVGTLSANRRYIGVDPHPKAPQAFAALKSFLETDALTFYPSAFEDIDLGDVLADLVFTSPPYFSVERYSNDSKQSWVRYPTWSLWVERFLAVLIAKSFQHLRSGGCLLLNVADSLPDRGSALPLIQTCVDLATTCGFQHATTLQMRLGTFGHKPRHEPILVFRKEGGACMVPQYTLPMGQKTLRATYGTSVSGLTEDSLRQFYEVDLLTDAEIARQFGVSDVLISQQRKRYGIKAMNPRQREDAKRGSGLSLDQLNADLLRELYGTKSDQEIADLYHTSKVTIRNRRHLWGIAAVSKTERVLAGKNRS